MHFPFPPPTGGFDEGDDFGPRRGGGVVSSNHMGVDFGKAGGTSIPAAGDGVVELSQWYSGYGNCTILNHGKNAFGQTLYTLYGHQQRLDTVVGQQIKSGQHVGPVGTTGNSTGNHLHFGTMVGSIGNYVDPVQFMKDYAGIGESATAGLGTNPLNNSQEDSMTATLLVTTNGGNQHYFNVGEEFIKHCGSKAQADIAAAINSGTDEVHDVNQTQFEDYLDAMGVPRAVVDIEGGKVLDLGINPPAGAKNASWSRRREAVQKLDQLLARVK